MATTFDIHYQILSPAEQAESYGHVFTFGFTTAVAVRGPQKLINRWLKCFLTPKGSDPIDLTYGTEFAHLFGGNVNQQTFSDVVTLSVEDATEQLRGMDRRAALDDDERVSGASVTGITVRNDNSYDVYISLVSVAGDVARFAIPTQISMRE